MKICLINSSYKGTNSEFEQFDELPDPGRYIPTSRHQFLTRYVSKANYKEEIDKICEESFDMFMNYMWGHEAENVAGVEATKYLESKGVVVLTNPSTFLAHTKHDLAKVAAATGAFRVASNTPGKFPKIVKYSDSYGSLNLDNDSICYNDEAVTKRIAYMQERMPDLGVMVQDYIVGKECSAMVIEMGKEAVALTPLQYVFPPDTPPEEEFLTWEHKFVSVDKGLIKYAFVDGQEKSDLQSAAVNAFKAIGAMGGGGWARIDMRIEHGTGQVWVIEINTIPVVFYPINNTLGDDMVVEETFPGQQPAFFDMLVATKRIQMGHNDKKYNNLASEYDAFDNYESVYLETNYYTFEKKLVAQFDFSGTVMELASGPGVFGKVVHESGQVAEITACDIAADMLEHPYIKQYYKQPAHHSPMEEYVMGAAESDHFVCFGALHFLDAETFNAVLARMFMLARKSVTFNIDDVTDEYIEKTKQVRGQHWINTNHTKALEEFGVPRGWRKVYESEREWMYNSPSIHTDVYGIVVRFERIQKCQTNGHAKPKLS